MIKRDIDVMIEMAKEGKSTRPLMMVFDALREAGVGRLVSYLKPYLHLNPSDGYSVEEIYVNYYGIMNAINASLEPPHHTRENERRGKTVRARVITDKRELYELFKLYEIRSDMLVSKDMIINDFVEDVVKPKPTVKEDYNSIIEDAKRYIRATTGHQRKLSLRY